MQEQDGIVEITGGGLGEAARVLAGAFAEDPVFVWALPKASTRLEDATAFFTFYLRRTASTSRKVFAAADHSAVAVMTTVKPGVTDTLALPALVRATSPATDYFRWIESFSPGVKHRYLEFIGSPPESRSKGQGGLLLKTLLSQSASEGLPVWCWSSNSRNLSFYHRLGFQKIAGLVRDNDTPPVTSLLRPAVPLPCI